MKNVIRFILASIIAFQVTACKFQGADTRALDSDFSAIQKQYQIEAESNALAGSAKIYERSTKLELIKTAYLASIQTGPTLNEQLPSDVAAVEKWITENQGSLATWNKQVEAHGTALRRTIFEISKASFNPASIDEAIRDQITTFYGILYYGKGNQALLRILPPVLLALGRNEFRNSSLIQNFKKEVLQITLEQVGLSVILKQDLKKVAQALAALKKEAPLNATLSDMVGKTAKELTLEISNNNSGIQKFAGQVNQYQEKSVAVMKAEIKKAFGNKTLLYTPGANSSSLVSISSWVGNLTWGLVNTLLGFGVVLVTMAVSPLTDSVDFPKFALSKNGKQIYVDVSGMGPIKKDGLGNAVGGKMSLGIWELANTTSPYASTGHEGAHAVQSAILGPFYLPAILLTYAISGFDKGFMEDWAWQWQNI